MRARIILIVLLVSLTTTVLAEEDSIASLQVLMSDLLAQLDGLVPIVPEPPLRILPEDVVQSSIRLISFSTNFSTNSFGIVWCYTEAGAKKVLAHWEPSTGKPGEPKQMRIGSYETTPQMFMFGLVPPLSISISHWKEEWLKRRTDQILDLNQAEANAVISALKGK